MASVSKKKSKKIAVSSGPKTLQKRHAFAIATMMMISLITFFTALVLIGYSALKYRYIGDGPLTAERVFEVPKGAGLTRVANALESSGAIASANIFKLFVKLDGGETTLKAGEFALPADASMRDIYEILKDGQAILYPLTFAEGLTSAQIIRLIDRVPHITGELAGVPSEGTLLPETYMLPKAMSKKELVTKMGKAQTDLLDALWDKRAENLPFKTKQEALILASVVEKETGQNSERHHVAGVFVNRLRNGMRLESDPTIIYGLTGGERLGRGLRRSEIDRKTDWNTYQIDGLPTTPICNPGRAAIEATLNPMATEDIFFVADGRGGHVFAKTLREHNNNVRKWRAIERQRKRVKAQ